MSKITIFSTGLVAGAINAFAWRTTDNIQEGSILIRGFQFLCQANQDTTWDCSSFMSIVSIIILLLSLAVVIHRIKKAGNWKVGLAFYLAGAALSFGVLFFALG